MCVLLELFNYLHNGNIIVTVYMCVFLALFNHLHNGDIIVNSFHVYAPSNVEYFT